MRCLRLAKSAMKKLPTQAAHHVAKRLLRGSDVRDEFVLMELLAARHHGLDHRDADAATDVAQQIDGAGNLAAFF